MRNMKAHPAKQKKKTPPQLSRIKGKTSALNQDTRQGISLPRSTLKLRGRRKQKESLRTCSKLIVGLTCLIECPAASCVRRGEALLDDTNQQKEKSQKE